MSFHALVFAYFAPDTYMPVTSILAAVIGVVLVTGRDSFRLAARYVRPLRKVAWREPTSRGPHLPVGDRPASRDARL
jgi:hypothetical protein